MERHVAAPELELLTSAAAAAVQRPAQQIPMAKLELELEQARAKIREMQNEVNHQFHDDSAHCCCRMSSCRPWYHDYNSYLCHDILLTGGQESRIVAA